jgi:UDP-2,4-diacetamido-2,4,6-trideoxy-beta-L-altropyranose hydrolase
VAKVYIRTDASTQIGAGHLVRCITLADAFRAAGANVEFICCDLGGGFKKLLCGKNYTVHELSGVRSQVTDALLTSEIISGRKINLMVVDHYELGLVWEKIIKPKVGKLLSIDDLGRKHICDLLLDQNYVSDLNSRYLKKVPPGCEVLLGPRYALLRPEFSNLRGPERGDREAKKLFIFFGSGSEAVTCFYLKILAAESFQDIYIDCVLGSYETGCQKIERLAERRPNTNIYHQVEDIGKIMSGADFALGALGTTTWERMCLGLPTAAILTAENQRLVMEAMKNNRLIWYLGDSRKAKTLKQGAYLNRVFKSKRNMEISRKSMKICDGLGASRVISAADL